MPASRPSPERKSRRAYHHGNLRQALLAQALRTIHEDGVDALTLRDVGARLRVSRTALYRHFSNKKALLSAVATEGFREFRLALSDAWDKAGRGRAGFEAQGLAYVRFARENPSHYRVMFGGALREDGCDTDLDRESTGAFRVLVDAIAELQRAGNTRPEPPELLALVAWSGVHGLAMLAIDGQLERPGVVIDDVLRFHVARLADALGIRA
jgi:AcrR family transcriptional regulator